MTPMTADNAALAADLILVAHFAVVAFIVGGQGLILAGWARGWGWTRGLAFRVAHVAAILFVVAQTWLGQLCPLTVWENELRIMAGQSGRGESFIGYWVGGVLYYHAPGWVFLAVYAAFGLLVVATFVLYPPRRR